jgi:hypothetical protein
MSRKVILAYIGFVFIAAGLLEGVFLGLTTYPLLFFGCLMILFAARIDAKERSTGTTDNPDPDPEPDTE